MEHYRIDGGVVEYPDGFLLEEGKIAGRNSTAKIVEENIIELANALGRGGKLDLWTVAETINFLKKNAGALSEEENVLVKKYTQILEDAKGKK
jgi:hypothetical protein